MATSGVKKPVALSPAEFQKMARKAAPRELISTHAIESGTGVHPIFRAMLEKRRAAMDPADRERYEKAIARPYDPALGVMPMPQAGNRPMPQAGNRPMPQAPGGVMTAKKGGSMKAKKGGSVKSSASKRADGCATKGKTRGKMC